MFSDNELQLLTDTLRRVHLEVRVTQLEALPELMGELGLAAGQREKAPCLESLEPCTMYKFSTDAGLCYIYLLMPTRDKVSVLFIGPYLSSSLPRESVMEAAERGGVSPKLLRYLQEYYEGLPVLSEGHPILLMLNVFCERMWDQPRFSIVDVTAEQEPAPWPLQPLTGDSIDDAAVSMRAMEQRYAFENELIEAVTLGQLHKETQLFAAFSAEAFERRLSDPLRNAKNYCVIMNTLLRKAAERGGVHPLYIDRLSSENAARIERMTDLSENFELMTEIFRSYCRLVRTHSTAGLSPVVRKAAILIDSDLSADLSLCTLAAALNVSLGYLSSVFKRETGKTVSEYIRERRIAYAAHLLDTTGLQIQTVALYCGIMDVQYFSKLFKRVNGMTPREYRERAR